MLPPSAPGAGSCSLDPGDKRGASPSREEQVAMDEEGMLSRVAVPPPLATMQGVAPQSVMPCASKGVSDATMPEVDAGVKIGVSPRHEEQVRKKKKGVNPPL
ncbi:unnamed protein product [Cuscuta epithymum]|uniref:Uncharacterized protein n=1 Tax=Cuscuta epithymum TaxID=186058 RepID=A0AAV0EC95_9ASTE|nr:unnamed protein product [Cuscuta epithymum]